MSRDTAERRSFSDFTKRTWIVLGATVSVAVVIWLLWQLAHVLLLIFAGTLIAVFLRGLAWPLAQRMPVSEGIALLIVIVLIVLGITAASVVLAPSVSEQTQSLIETLPQAVNNSLDYLDERQWGTWLIERVPRPGEVAEAGDGIMANFFGVFSTALGAVANLLFIVVLAVYLAANPSIYWRGIVLLVPEKKRPRAAEIVHTLGEQLWHWLKGQFVMMVVVGTLTGIALKIAGVPLALALGVIAGLFEFVPIVGPIAAAVPGVLIALAHSPTTGLYAIIVYLFVQQLEGNVLTPLVMRRMVSLPPALTLSATIIAGVMFGIAGVLLATPLALMVVILVRMIYVNDVLGDDVAPVPQYKKGRSR